MVFIMPSLKSPKGSSIRPYKLTYQQLAAIGKMMRACAEIEDILSLYLYKLADISEGAGMILLERVGIVKKLKIVAQYAKAHGQEQVRLYNEAFNNDYFRDLVKCRNTLAHGYLLGITDDDEIAFQVQETQGVEGDKLFGTVNTYGHEDFKNLARMAEDIIPQLEAALGLQSLRQERRSPTLSAHSQSQGRTAGHQHPHQSSQQLARQAKLDRKAAQRRDPKNKKKRE